MTAVVIFLYKRTAGLEQIFAKIRDYSPGSMYLIADGPKTISDAKHVDAPRELALRLIDWKCDVYTNFHSQNEGVYQNIGLGAKWVFEREETAIFLEDDTIPEDTFFRYCDIMLDRYRQTENIFWICGTNYSRNGSDYGSSYYYTKCLLPCGWASWSDKFLRYYDGELTTLSPSNTEKMKSSYLDQRLFGQEYQAVFQTRENIKRDIRSVSWDRQLIYSIRTNGLYGIAPNKNQIRNIGADALSEHGGTSLTKVMTRRFCEVPTSPLVFPLVAPKKLQINLNFEIFTEQTILYPFIGRVKRKIGRFIKILFRLSPDDSLRLYMKNKKWKR